MGKKCEEMAPLISAYLDGEGPESQRRQVKGHLASCEDCLKLARELDMTGQLIKEALFENSESQWHPAPSDPRGPIKNWIKRLIETPVVWAPTAVAAAAVFLMVFTFPLDNSKKPVGVSRVESVFSRSGKVMILQSGNAGEPIIWILPKESTSG